MVDLLADGRVAVDDAGVVFEPGLAVGGVLGEVVAAGLEGFDLSLGAAGADPGGDDLGLGDGVVKGGKLVGGVGGEGAVADRGGEFVAPGDELFVGGVVDGEALVVGGGVR